MLRFSADVFQTPGEPSRDVGSLSVVELSLTLGEPKSGSRRISGHQSHPECLLVHHLTPEKLGEAAKD